MGPFFKRYYILVLIDYGSCFTVLVPCDNCGAIVTADAIVTHWVPYFGWFSIFKSDLGSSFKSTMNKLSLKAMDVEQYFAEPRYHQSIGKVERVIGVVQSVLRSLNIEFDNKFVSRIDPNTSWEMIKSILPLIQFSINRRKSRISTLSPAMLMLGEQINDVPDIVIAIDRIKHGLNNNKFHKDKHLYLQNLVKNLTAIKNRYKHDWYKYTHLSKKYYDKRYNLLPKRDANGKIIPHSHAFGYEPISQFKKGMRVLYYVGPHKAYNGKWRQMWTGPWSIISEPDELHIKITDKKGNIRAVSIDRLKIFKKRDLNEFENWSNDSNILKMTKDNQPNMSDNDDDEEMTNPQSNRS